MCKNFLIRLQEGKDKRVEPFFCLFPYSHFPKWFFLTFCLQETRNHSEEVSAYNGSYSARWYHNFSAYRPISTLRTKYKTLQTQSSSLRRWRRGRWGHFPCRSALLRGAFQERALLAVPKEWMAQLNPRLSSFSPGPECSFLPWYPRFLLNSQHYHLKLLIILVSHLGISDGN